MFFLYTTIMKIVFPFFTPILKKFLLYTPISNESFSCTHLKKLVMGD